MISLSHWSIRYAFDRARLAAYSSTHIGWPWFAPQANAFLEKHLSPTAACFEWGSGRSTLWLARRVASLTSVEHDPTWYKRVRHRLEHMNAANVLYHFVHDDADHYVAPIQTSRDASLDLVIVDGPSELRDRCALAAIDKLRSGAFLLIDDAHRYFPAPSNAPNALPAHAEPPSADWQQFIERTKDWRYNRFASGVTDTIVWMKP